MSEGMNKWIGLGNLGADPELAFTQGGTAILKLRLGCTTSYLDKNKQRAEKTNWINIVVWGKRGEALANILHKGSSILVEGELSISSYDDRDGNKKYKTEIIASNIILTGGRGNAQGEAEPQVEAKTQGQRPQRKGAQTNAAIPQDDFGYDGAGGEDIPF